MAPGAARLMGGAALAACASPAIKPPASLAAVLAGMTEDAFKALSIDLTVTPSSSDTSRDACPRDAKSAKRKAAEALLERKAGRRQRVAAQEARPAPSTRPAVVVPPCGPGCASAAAGRRAAPQGRRQHADVEWCSMRLSIPPLEWPAILAGLATRQGKAPAPAELPGGLAVRIVESAAQVAPALAELRESMLDGVVGIDLEWRPDLRPGRGGNRVALIQLASGSMAVLVRCCRMRHLLPSELLRFFADPSLTFVSFSWDSCDEGKMVSTFGAGRACFARFADLQRVAEALGYQSVGLAKLTQRVLGITLPKSRSVARSDWERPLLSPVQVQYAALDALMTGYVFRGLRLWHASPSACPACRQLLGVVPDNAAIGVKCAQCEKSCKDLLGLMCHITATGHLGGASVCDECGRLRADAAAAQH